MQTHPGAFELYYCACDKIENGEHTLRLQHQASLHLVGCSKFQSVPLSTRGSHATHTTPQAFPSCVIFPTLCYKVVTGDFST